MRAAPKLSSCVKARIQLIADGCDDARYRRAKVTPHVRHHSQFSATVIMMSANEHSEIVLSAAGRADDYLLKPVTMKQVKFLWQHVWRKQYQPRDGSRLNEYGEELDEDNEDTGLVCK